MIVHAKVFDLGLFQTLSLESLEVQLGITKKKKKAL